MATGESHFSPQVFRVEPTPVEIEDYMKREELAEDEDHDTVVETWRKWDILQHLCGGASITAFAGESHDWWTKFLLALLRRWWIVGASAPSWTVQLPKGIFRPSATNSGRPNGVMHLSSSWNPHHPPQGCSLTGLTPSTGLIPHAHIWPPGRALHCHVTWRRGRSAFTLTKRTCLETGGTFFTMRKINGRGTKSPRGLNCRCTQNDVNGVVLSAFMTRLNVHTNSLPLKMFSVGRHYEPGENASTR